MSLDISAYDALFPSGIGADVIEQIPLGQTVFPFKDLDASGRMIRQPLYGDDIIPVSALVVGQHPTTGDAQTVDTDGRHRLLVSAGSGSSFGLGPVEMKSINYYSSSTPLTFGWTNPFGATLKIGILYGIDFWVTDTVTAPARNDTNDFSVALQKPTVGIDGHEYFILTSLRPPQDAAHGQPYAQNGINLRLPVPMIIPATYRDSNGFISVWVQSRYDGWDYDLTLYYTEP